MMKELESVVTRKGQITIPAPIRRALALEEGDRVAFFLQGQEVRLTRKASIVARTAGIFRQRGAPPSAEDLRQAAERAIAENAVARQETQ